MKQLIIILAFWLIALIGPSTSAVEQDLSGLVDMRYTFTDGIESYLNGDYGKFRDNDGSHLSLSHSALNYKVNWENNLSLVIIANAYVDGVYDHYGMSEAYFQYKSLPTQGGYRFKMRGGFMYPKVSMTNFLTAWTSPYTLNYSAINSWLAEEMRHQGIEVGFTRLGKFSASDWDADVNIAFFQANDPAGAMLSWDGWLITSRQTLRSENPKMPNSEIGFVPENSNVFLELDHKTGYHFNTKLSWKHKVSILLGYYDNNADPRVVKDVQWAWRTRFNHLGFKWQIEKDLTLIGQYLKGDTLMQTSSGSRDLVNADYSSAYLMLTKKYNQHRFTGRIENFEVVDKDGLPFDNNDEEGDSFTLNYTYQINKNWFFHNEYTFVNSHRVSRTNRGHPNKLIEKQLIFGVRYFF